MTPTELSAAEAVRQLGDGEITSEALVTACLERIDEVDGDVQAWTHLDPEFALAQARERPSGSRPPCRRTSSASTPSEARKRPSTGSRTQAVRWMIASAMLVVEGVEQSTDLATGGGCEIVAPSIDFPQFVGACATGFVLDATDEPVDVRLALEVTSMQVIRAVPLDLSETVDFDGDGVLNDGDGSGSAFDNPCGLTGQTSNCDDNSPRATTGWRSLPRAAAGTGSGRHGSPLRRAYRRR